MKKKCLLFLIIVVCCSGCSAEYNLTIDKKGFYEDISVFADSVSENELLVKFPFTAYYDVADNNVNPMVKISGVDYYKDELYSFSNLNRLKYSYLFRESGNFIRSRAVHSAYDTFIFKRYDYDEDGDNDYIIFSTDDNFRLFDIYDKLNNLTVRIHCRYKIISSNADEVSGNYLIWHFTKDKIKPINMVYDPDKYVDDRTFWERIKDGDYTNSFTIFLAIFLGIGIIIFLFKKKGDRRNRV